MGFRLRTKGRLTVILLLVGIGALALGVEIGRWWQRHEHAPRFDETLSRLARKDHTIDSLQQALAREKAAHRATARKGDEWRGQAREYAARLANRGAA